MSKPSITNCPNTFFRKFIVSAVDSRLNREGRWFFTGKYSLLVCKYVIPHYQVVIAVRSHLFPFRTEKLSSLAPMVLQCGRVGSRLLLSRASDFERFLRLFCFPTVLLSNAAFPTESWAQLLLPFYPFTFLPLYVFSVFS